MLHTIDVSDFQRMALQFVLLSRAKRLGEAWKKFVPWIVKLSMDGVAKFDNLKELPKQLSKQNADEMLETVEVAVRTTLDE